MHVLWVVPIRSGSDNHNIHTFLWRTGENYASIIEKTKKNSYMKFHNTVLEIKTATIIYFNLISTNLLK